MYGTVHLIGNCSARHLVEPITYSQTEFKYEIFKEI